MNPRFLLLLALGAAACSPKAPGTVSAAPKSNANFTNWLVATAGPPGERNECTPSTIDLGRTWRAPVGDRQLSFHFPAAFLADSVDPWEVLPERVSIAGFDRKIWLRPWTPGIYIGGARYLWTRMHASGDRIEALFQVDAGQYQLFAATPPWRITLSPECVVRLRKGPMRVIFFEMRHPTRPPQWGLVAYWPDVSSVIRYSIYLSALAIGPDQAFQAEAMQILRGQVP